jgi:DedD protein
VVQVGAFTDDAKIREVRVKVEKIGLKTYTQQVDTPGGKRVRVRVGPFASKAEADKVAARIKADGLPAAAVLAL